MHCKERWKNRKCLDYCAVADNCEYGKKLKEITLNAA